MVFAEANSMGVPVVSFDSGGISEAVSHGETGFLAPEKDIDILASYIKTLFKDEELWSEFSKNGIERVRSLYNLKENTKGLEEIYKKTLR
ncbi:glycosyltransferase [Bacillus paranthracis]